MHSAAEPVIDNHNRFIRIKSYIVEQDTNDWMVTHQGNVIVRFGYRSWAVAWAVAMVNNDLSTCAFLVKNNEQIEKLNSDRALYRYYLKNTTDETKHRILEDRVAKAEKDLDELIWDTHQVMRYQGFV